MNTEEVKPKIKEIKEAINENEIKAVAADAEFDCYGSYPTVKFLLQDGKIVEMQESDDWYNPSRDEWM